MFIYIIAAYILSLLKKNKQCNNFAEMRVEGNFILDRNGNLKLKVIRNRK